MRSRITAVALCLSAIAAVAQAEIENGDFEMGAVGDCPSGWTCEGSVSIWQAGTSRVARLDEPGSGGVSRLYQVITAPSAPAAGRISFRYAFVSTPVPGAAPTNTRPDSFAAFLVDPNTGRRWRLINTDPPSTNPISWGRGFFGVDMSAMQDFASAAKTLPGPDTGWLYAVAFQTDVQPGQQLRLEFALAGAANGRTAYAVVDDVMIGCPPGYCCNQRGDIAWIDDGDRCTKDICENGVATHVNCCDHIAVVGRKKAVMFMLDISPSMSPETKVEIQEALLNILNAFDPNEMRIGIGRFGVRDPNDPNNPNRAIAQVLKPPTANYNSVRAKLMDPDFLEDSWGSPLADAITKARTALGEPNEHWTRSIVLLTDGFANIPPGPSACEPSGCECSQARDAAMDAAVACGPDVLIYAKMYYGTDGLNTLGNPRCPDGNKDGYGVVTFMHDSIVTYFPPDHPQALFPPDPNAPPQQLTCELADLMRLVATEDNDPPE